jgi:hypothetical protein
MKYNREIYLSIVYKRKLNQSIKEIAETLNLPFDTLRSIWRRYLKKGTPLPDNKNCGRRKNPDLKDL